MELILCLLIGFSSSVVSAVTGLAGGVILFSLLGLRLPFEAVIPLHALLQVFANFSRVAVFKEHVHKRKFLFFTIGVVPGALLGAYLSAYIPKIILQYMIGCIIIYIALKNIFQRTNKVMGDSASMDPLFTILGIISSLFGMIVGVVGPFIAPFFLQSGLEGKAFVGTKSACQFTTQLTKSIIFFSVMDFNYLEYPQMIISLTIGIVAGTLLGKHLIDFFNKQLLFYFINLILIVLGLKNILA